MITSAGHGGLIQKGCLLAAKWETIFAPKAGITEATPKMKPRLIMPNIKTPVQVPPPTNMWHGAICLPKNKRSNIPLKIFLMAENTNTLVILF